jgi:hypothetical protein
VNFGKGRFTNSHIYIIYEFTNLQICENFGSAPIAFTTSTAALSRAALFARLVFTAVLPVLLGKFFYWV